MQHRCIGTLDGQSLKANTGPAITDTLFIDDNELLAVTKECLESMLSMKVDTACDLERAGEFLATRAYDAALCDYDLDGRNGMDLLRQLRAEGSYIPFILFTGKGGEQVTAEALNSGADLYLQKGLEMSTTFSQPMTRLPEVIRRRQDEESIKQSERRLRYLMDNMGDVLLQVGRGGIMGEDITKRQEVKLLINGSERVYDFTIAPLRRDSRIVVALHIVRDVTMRRREEEELRLANNKLGMMQELTRHDLMNQMSIPSRYLDLCEKQTKEVSTRNHVARSRMAVENMARQLAFAREYQMLWIHEPEWQSLESIMKRASEAFDLRKRAWRWTSSAWPIPCWRRCSTTWWRTPCGMAKRSVE